MNHRYLSVYLQIIHQFNRYANLKNKTFTCAHLFCDTNWTNHVERKTHQNLPPSWISAGQNGAKMRFKRRTSVTYHISPYMLSTFSRNYMEAP